jgi:hypothetical protein
MKLLLCCLIVDEKLFTLDSLNDRIQAFDFGYNIFKDEPSTIGQSKLFAKEARAVSWTVWSDKICFELFCL